MYSELSDLTSDELLTYIQHIIDDISNIYSIVGDTPVSEQINTALSQTLSKSQAHEKYVPYAEYIALKQTVDMLVGLVGDMPVSEQIGMAINNTK